MILLHVIYCLLFVRLFLDDNLSRRAIFETPSVWSGGSVHPIRPKTQHSLR